MTKKNHCRLTVLAAVLTATLAFGPTGLLAQVAGDPTGDTAGDTTGGTTGDTSGGTTALEQIDAPLELGAILADWSGEATTLEIYLADSRPDIAQLYLDQVESRHESIGTYFDRNFPEITEAFRAESGLEPSREPVEFFRLAVTERAAYGRWQEELARDELDLEPFIAATYPTVLLDLQAVNVRPADSWTLIDYMVEKGYDAGLIDQARGMIDDILPPTLPPGSCQCFIQVWPSMNPTTWTQTVDDAYYDGAPLPVIDTAFTVSSAGPAVDIYGKRRTKAKSYEYGNKSENSNYVEMSIRMNCLDTDDPNGAICKTGSCTSGFTMRTKYSAKVRERLDVGLGKGKVLVYNAAKMTYNKGKPSEKVIAQHGIAASGDKRTVWDVEGFLGPLLNLVADITEYAVSEEEASFFDEVEVSNIVDVVSGAANLHHIEGADSDQAYSMVLPIPDQSGTLIPHVTYTMRLESESRFYGWGKLHAHTRTYGWIDSSFMMAAAASNFVCDAHVIAPEKKVWWAYGAAPDAPEGADFLRDEISGFSLLQLNFGVPGNELGNGQSGKGWHPN